jgi:hypothetical protein
MGKVDTETENYGATQNAPEKVVGKIQERIDAKELQHKILESIKKVEGVNTVDTVVTYNPYNFSPCVNFNINGVLTSIRYSLELIQDCLHALNEQYSEKLIEIIVNEVKEFISTGKVSEKKNINTRVEEVDGKLVLNFYYEDGTPLYNPENK